jgi:hypothetical protein
MAENKKNVKCIIQHDVVLLHRKLIHTLSWFFDIVWFKIYLALQRLIILHITKYIKELKNLSEIFDTGLPGQR